MINSHPSRNRRFRLIPVVIATLFLAACQTTPTGAPDSQFFGLGPGSTVVLNQSLDVPAKKSVAYVVEGRSVRKTRMYYPYCYFEMLRPRSEFTQPTTIEADTFSVKSVSRRKDIASSGQIMFASVDVGINLAGSFVGGGTNQHYLNTYIELESERQPQVKNLICGIFGHPADVNWLNVPAINEQLGPIATLNAVPVQ